MIRRGIVAAAVGCLALWATGSIAADNVIPLNIRGGADVATQTLGYDGDADTELLRYRGGYYGGAGRGYYGGYGRGYYGGGYARGFSGYGRGYYGGGYARGYYGYGRGYYGGGYAGYRNYYYPRFAVYANFYQPYYGGYYYGPSSYYNGSYYYDPYCPLNGEPGYMPYATQLGQSPNVPAQNLGAGAIQAPVGGNGTYRYDGGPSQFVPQPGRTEPAPAPKTAPAVPNTRLVSIPNPPASGFAYPAYGEQPRSTAFASDSRR